MSISKIKTNSKGIYVDFEFRRKKDNGENFSKYKRAYLDNELSKTKLNQQIKLLYADFIQECEEEFKINSQNLNNNITLAGFIDVYLESLKNTKSISHYAGSLFLSKIVKDKIGKYKLKELTPIIIQDFYDYIASLKMEKTHIFPRKNFEELLSKYNYKSKKFSKEINSAHFRNLAKAKAGQEVSIIWAKEFAEYLKIPLSTLFIEANEQDDYSYTMKKKYSTFLKSCLSEAKKKLLIKENYAKSDYTTFMKNNNPNKELLVLKEEEFLKLYDYVLKLENSLCKIFMVLILNTGARKEEIFGLKWKNINFKEQTLEFQNTVTAVSGFGKIINENKTKNISSNRIVNFSNEVLFVLEDYKKSLNNIKEDSYIFVKNNEVVHPSIANRWLNKILKEINLPHYTVHSLRHTYASLMINCMPLANVSKRLGHSQISTTLNFYAHQIKDDDKIKPIKDILKSKNNINNEIYNSLKLLKDNGIISEEEFLEKLKKQKE